MDGSKPQIDVYDEEFYNNLQLAKKMVTEIRNRRDKDICKKWIGKLLSLKSDDPIVKKNRNSFFKYMLQMLDKAAKEASTTPQYDDRVCINKTSTKMLQVCLINFSHTPSGKKKLSAEETEFMSKWSGDNRTYIAAKPLPGQGALIYMAVSSDPSLGWDHM
ncbi:uncharacterized protein LOC111692327 [Anoplophora glabripennis]|uniref:uncharacterized protein LOC111692327 n=1 Tax=Anoplophora glabripennis TaxID=217634 RepID=UPI000C774DA8|nr:uncharacterized protein LOC111692327 [Anoplophora glabripennis]